MSNAQHLLHTYAVEQLRDLIGLPLQRVRFNIGRFVRPAVAEEVWRQHAVSAQRKVVELAAPIE